MEGWSWHIKPSEGICLRLEEVSNRILDVGYPFEEGGGDVASGEERGNDDGCKKGLFG
jgi:hypothetical protein